MDQNINADYKAALREEAALLRQALAKKVQPAQFAGPAFAFAA